MPNSLKSAVACKAAKVTVKHTAHGAASKLKRDPVRAGTLLALGFLASRFAAPTPSA